MNIQESYFKILEKIQKCKSYTERVKLVAVSKFKPVQDMLQLYQVGHRIFAENRIQEARDKKPHLPQDLKLHLVGAIQTNKIKYIPTIFDTVHSLCDLKVAYVLEKKCLEQGKKMEVLLQMNLCQEEQKSGLLNYEELVQVAAELVKLQQLKVVGLMTIPAFNLSLEKTATVYANLREYKEKLAQELGIKEQLTELSMGMSGDFEIAIEEGATYVRIGTALFGER